MQNFAHGASVYTGEKSVSLKPGIKNIDNRGLAGLNMLQRADERGSLPRCLVLNDYIPSLWLGPANKQQRFTIAAFDADQH